MFVLVFLSWENGSNLQRLTRGADYKGSLCGVDEGVEDLRFLYFCSKWTSTEEIVTKGAAVDLERPSCVAECPQQGGAIIPCLQEQMITQTPIAERPQAGMAGIQSLNIIHVSESVVETAPYDTIALRGKYCVPQNSTLKEQVLHGPKMGGMARVLNSLGSLRRPWLWLFMVVLVCCLAGYIYLFMLKMAAKPVVLLSMTAASTLFILGGVYFLIGILGLPAFRAWDGTPDVESLDGWFSSDLEWFFFYCNPMYSVNNRADAAFWSGIMGVFLTFCGLFLGCKMCTLGRMFEDGIDLIEVASECMHTIGWLMIQPLLLALLQFFVLLVLTYGFMELITQGSLETDRVFIDNTRYEGLSAEYKFDTWRIGWSVFFYLIGAWWTMEVTISIGQFMIAFCIIAWYFMPKEDKSHVKRPPPRMKLLTEMYSSLFRHFGTICLGAFCISYARVWRFTIGYFYDFSPTGGKFVWETDTSYDEDDFLCKACHSCNVSCVGGMLDKKKHEGWLQCCCRWCFGESEVNFKGRKGAAAPASCCGLCGGGGATAEVGCIRRFCDCSLCCKEDPFCAWLSGASDKSFFMPFSWADLSHCTKDVYNDVIIRATDFFPANVRTRQIFGSVPACASIKGSGQTITIIGVSFIPLVGIAAFAGFMQLETVQDESGSWYVSDPVMVGYFTMLLCMLVAYSFCMVFDHTADTLLYCYAWHKRNDKGSIDKFIPDKLRYIVGWGDLNNDKYPYYGKAPNAMYLSTFVDWKAKGKAKAGGGGGGGTPLDPNTSIFFRDDDGGETMNLLTRG